MKKIFCLMALLSTFTHAAEWDYKNQGDWVISHGERQSPINIEEEKTISDENYIALDIKLNPNVMVENNGHSINLKGTGTSTLKKRVFNFMGMHMHSPSEHQINGEYYPMEFHFVHTASNGRLGVTGVFAKVGKENKEFQKILNHLKTGKLDKALDINFEVLFPKNKDYYHYLGSLTTPPLTENVEWYVIDEAIEISQTQLTEFNSYYLNNNREIQDLNERKIIKSK